MLKNRIVIIDNKCEEQNRLSQMFSEKYETYVVDGSESLTFNKEEISVVFCDAKIYADSKSQIINMLNRDRYLAGIPVIVTYDFYDETLAKRCFEAGVIDYLCKPYNYDIVYNKVRNIIEVRKKYNMIHETKYDRLTGACNKGYFFENVTDMLQLNSNTQYDIICCDIVNFKMINEKYSSDVGDQILNAVVNINLFEKKELLCGRIASNTFATITERIDSYDRLIFENYISRVIDEVPVNTLTIKFGIYRVTDRNIPVSSMCDRAVMAINSIKHKYDELFTVFDETMMEELYKEQKISDCMEQGLRDGEFSVYLQPKHDLTTSAVAGAEALVRWNSSKYGFMMPGDFIPVFEKNGFITNIDIFVWEETCRVIKSWIDRGIVPVPVSVNISRLDFEKMDLTSHLSGLIEKYNIPVGLLHLEVTETVYTNNPDKIIQCVEELRNIGFKIEMDDFGSGYSSLNMLSDLPIDILKLDMKFMRYHKNPENNRRIVSFILSLSKWLGLATVAEGVETEADANLLASMGCNMVQGYLYAKPMPIKEYERYVQSCENELKVQDFKLEPDNIFTIQKRNIPVRVLIVEDVKFNRALLTNMLNPYYETAECEDGQQAYEYIEKEYKNITVILLDIMMPVMDGFQLIKLLKSDDRYNHIPVIITSEAGKDGELKAIQMGARDFISKPYRKEVIIHRIEQAIDERELDFIKKNY